MPCLSYSQLVNVSYAVMIFQLNKGTLLPINSHAGCLLKQPFALFSETFFFSSHTGNKGVIETRVGKSFNCLQAPMCNRPCLKKKIN